MLLGSYSDRAGRKIGIILPLLGALISALGCIIVTALKMPFWYIFIGNFMSGFSGGPTTMLTACYSYIADITTHEQRSKRMVIISLCEGVGAVVVQIGVGVAIQNVGFVSSSAILCGFYALCFLYAIFLLQDTIIIKSNTVILSKEQYLKPIRLHYRDNGTNRL